MYHVPVLLDEVIKALNLRGDGVYLDGTMGGGGHLQAIVDRLGPAATAVGIDRDPQAVEWCASHLRPGACRLITAQERFSDFGLVLDAHGIAAVNGLLVDLGVSSHQLDQPLRGFSHQSEGPLDMRMGPNAPRTAAQLLREEDADTVASILREYGEVRGALRMARLLAAQARAGGLNTTTELRECLRREYGSLHPRVLSQVFQALRIAVNGELDELRRFLAAAAGRLVGAGRLVVIAYHSLEDRSARLRVAERCA